MFPSNLVLLCCLSFPQFLDRFYPKIRWFSIALEAGPARLPVRCSARAEACQLLLATIGPRSSLFAIRFSYSSFASFAPLRFSLLFFLCLLPTATRLHCVTPGKLLTATKITTHFPLQQDQIGRNLSQTKMVVFTQPC